MKAVHRVVGTMVPLPRSDVDTDQIIPQQFLKRVERTGYGEFLFYNWAHDDDGSPRPEFVVNDPGRRQAKVLVAGRNFGCGSSREHAVWAIQDWGFQAMVAPSFADIFRNNAINVGLLPVELPEDVVDRLLQVAADPRAEAVVDLEEQTVSAGEVRAGFDIDPDVKERLLLGLDPIGMTLKLETDLARYEAKRPGWLPEMTS